MPPFSSSKVLFCLDELLKAKREGEGPEERTPATRRASERRQMARERRTKVTMLERFKSALGKGGWWDGCVGESGDAESGREREEGIRAQEPFLREAGGGRGAGGRQEREGGADGEVVIGDAEDWRELAAGKEPQEGHLGLATSPCSLTSPLAWMVEGDWKVMHQSWVNTGPLISPPSWIVR